MKMKLAEYEDGKFLRFLELEDYDKNDRTSFLYGKDCIKIVINSKLRQKGKIFPNMEYCNFFKDQTDPLNRFDGLFDGRTYGEGRFVLMYKGKRMGSPECWKDSILHKNKVIGNIHQSPQLFKELNND